MNYKIKDLIVDRAKSALNFNKKIIKNSSMENKEKKKIHIKPAEVSMNDLILHPKGNESQNIFPNIKESTNSSIYEHTGKFPYKTIYKNNNNNFTTAQNQKKNLENVVNINKKLINDLNEQIKFLNEQNFLKKFNYKQTVNLQKLNDYIIYEYTKNKMRYGLENNTKSTTSFRLPLPYRRMGNHGKKEDLIPINNQPKINLENVLILHNSHLRNSMTENKVKNFYLKNNLKYKKYQGYNESKYDKKNRKKRNEKVSFKFVNILSI